MVHTRPKLKSWQNTIGRFGRFGINSMKLSWDWLLWHEMHKFILICFTKYLLNINKRKLIMWIFYIRFKIPNNRNKTIVTSIGHHEYYSTFLDVAYFSNIFLNQVIKKISMSRPMHILVDFAVTFLIKIVEMCWKYVFFVSVSSYPAQAIS